MSTSNVLFVCEMNTCRSQIAEGWARHLHPDKINPFSAGINPGALDPLGVRVMQEVGVDISAQETHAVRDFLQEDIDWLVTVCDVAAEKCPSFPPEVNVICQSFDDPPGITSELEDEEKKLDVYRRVRDEIREFVEDIPNQLVR